MSAQNNNPRGIVLVIIAMSLFAMQDALIKFVFEKSALLFTTSIDILIFSIWICFSMRTPVEISAAIPWTAQKIESNGFWFIHICLSLTEAELSSILSTLTPVNHAAGSFKKKNKF